ATGLRVSIGRAFATVLVRGKPNGPEEEFCAAPVLLKKETNKMAQKAEISFQVFGHEVPQTAVVKIRRKKIVGGSEENALLATLSANVRVSGVQNVLSGEAVWEYNDPIDLDASYTAELVLDEGMGGELISTPQIVPFSFLINKYPPTFNLKNNKSAAPDPTQPDRLPLLGEFPFLLGAKAKVTLTINGQAVKPVDPQTGQPNGKEVFPFGLTIFNISKASFANSEVPPDGQYQFELKAVYNDNAISETHIVQGFATISSITNDIRQPGGIVVNNVELKSGNLGLTYPDVNIPNRGMPLELKRSYNSAVANIFSPFGYGWRHNYQVLLSFDPKDKVYTLFSGDGGTVTFKEANLNPTTNLMKAEGTNRSSLAKNADGSFDFITLQQTKYHFKNAVVTSVNEAISVGYMGNLDYIEERNKNRLTLKYDSYGRLEKISASANRYLEFVYEQTESATISGLSGEAGAVPCAKKNALKLLQKKFLQAYARKAWRVTEVKGPGGLLIRYGYDNKGNLARAARVGLDDTISDSIQNAEWKYAYDQTDGASSSAVHLLKSVQSPNHTDAEPSIIKYKYNLTQPELPVEEILMPENIVNKFAYEKLS
ncbi:MAG TPA: DUF6531 domain-containing protein, partial [Pyrinomonadaceae bacterium]|nr:DUF6531 domain-containing protein [Pyrinomonadaceae bacterium]